MRTWLLRYGYDPGWGEDSWGGDKAPKLGIGFRGEDRASEVTVVLLE